MVSLRWAVYIWSFQTINVYFRTQNSLLRNALEIFQNQLFRSVLYECTSVQISSESVFSPSLSISKTLRNTLVDVSL